MAYIYPAPGNAAKQLTLSINIASEVTPVLLSIAALQDITVNAANDVFEWTQLDSASKKTIATTATNSLEMNLVVDQTTFFGTTGASTSAVTAGIFGLSTNKERIKFSLYLGDTSTGSEGKTLTGYGYVTGLAPTVSADEPVWVSPITISMDSDYTVA